MVPNKTEIIEILKEGVKLYLEKDIREFTMDSEDLSADFARNDTLEEVLRDFLRSLDDFLNWGYEE